MDQRRKPKIVIIGAGSVIFGMACIQDAFYTKGLWGSELVFVDINEEALDRMVSAAKKFNDELSASYTIYGETDRCKALPNADYVIISIAVNRVELWKQDFQIPQKHGVPQILGENGGPGALFHTMRNIPIMLEIAKDIEVLAPEALVLNFTNPESRLCMTLKKHTDINIVGLCHQINAGTRCVATILGRKPEDLAVKAFGLNHFTWFADIRDKETGEDLYPELKQKEKEFDPEFETLSRYMYRLFGLYPTSKDDHLGEYLPYAHEMTNAEGYDYDQYAQRGIDGIKLVEGIIDGSVPLEGDLLSSSVETAFQIINAIESNSNEVIPSANIQNNGCIPNLPDDAIVEVPVVVSGRGIEGINMGPLPEGIAALCMSQINLQRLVVEAGVTGNKKLALQALLIDPCIKSAKAAGDIFNELFDLQKEYLPQFAEETL